MGVDFLRQGSLLEQGSALENRLASKLRDSASTEAAFAPKLTFYLLEGI
ncbi:hypothetical protein O987_15580 [Comamonas testosteroni TK102]|uniref:Uncharacterized protein n=1 Tax=Comamonas testosteroni TK102 TaxID=1392005 RepID=A0A076PNB8_COMTE|nr:hypothetical protein O987_15580 [Comamonas testosteroni TK102]